MSGWVAYILTAPPVSFHLFELRLLTASTLAVVSNDVFRCLLLYTHQTKQNKTKQNKTKGELNETTGTKSNLTGLAGVASTRYFLDSDGNFARELAGGTSITGLPNLRMFGFSGGYGRLMKRTSTPSLSLYLS